MCRKRVSIVEETATGSFGSSKGFAARRLTMNPLLYPLSYGGARRRVAPVTSAPCESRCPGRRRRSPLRRRTTRCGTLGLGPLRCSARPHVDRRAPVQRRTPRHHSRDADSSLPPGRRRVAAWSCDGRRTSRRRARFRRIPRAFSSRSGSRLMRRSSSTERRVMSTGVSSQPVGRIRKRFVAAPPAPA